MKELIKLLTYVTFI